MSFDIIKNGIMARLKALGYQESKQAFTFENAANYELGNTFILNVVSGTARTEESQRIGSSLYDHEVWEVKIAFKKSGKNDVIVRDDIQRKRQELLSDLDDADNWQSFAKFLRFEAWEVDALDDYVVLKIELYIVDEITY